MTRIYVGNLPSGATEEQLLSLFSSFGRVRSVKLIVDRATGESRGFAFVDMEAGDARGAITRADGQQFGGRALRVGEARDRAQGPAGRGRRRDPATGRQRGGGG